MDKENENNENNKNNVSDYENNKDPNYHTKCLMLIDSIYPSIKEINNLMFDVTCSDDKNEYTNRTNTMKAIENIYSFSGNIIYLFFRNIRKNKSKIEEMTKEKGITNHKDFKKFNNDIIEKSVRARSIQDSIYIRDEHLMIYLPIYIRDVMVELPKLSTLINFLN